MKQADGRAQHSRFGNLLVGEGQPVRIMGVINVSPESFFKQSVAGTTGAVKRIAEHMTAAGADIIDVGARSSAPYLHTDISEAEETERMCRAIRAVCEVTDVPVSANTQVASVATEARKVGATILNDVSGLAFDVLLADVAKEFEGVILMANADFTNVLGDPLKVVKQSLRAAVQRAKHAGIALDKIAVDPGIGYFRNRDVSWDEWDRAVLHNLAEFKDFGMPILVGLSRKSFIGKILGYQDAADRLYGSLGLTSLAVTGGTNIIRTHDVAETRDVVRVAEWLAGTSDA